MMNILSAIGSIGTFIMALFYFISVSIQLYQMKMSFLPALGFNQILMVRDGDRLTVRNTMNHNKEELGDDFLMLYNLGAGAAKHIVAEIYLNGGELLQRKYINILPSKESYLLPINKDVIDELDRTIANNAYEADLQIKLKYKHSVSRKTQVMTLNSQIDLFNQYTKKSIYELQFI